MDDDLVQRLRMFAKKPHALSTDVARASVLGEVDDALARKDAEIAELREEVEKYKVAWTEYYERTEWVQQTSKPRELGMHRADVLRLRIEQAEARAERAEAMVREATRADAAATLRGLGLPVHPEWADKTFALVLLDTEGAK